MLTRNIFQQLYYKDLEKVYAKFSGVILDNVVGEIEDLQVYFSVLRKVINKDIAVLISYHNPKWEPLLNLASLVGLRKKNRVQNWLDQKDLNNLLQLSGFDVITSQTRFFGITTITVAHIKKIIPRVKNYSVSIIVPARNEEGNIDKIAGSIPKFGSSQEIIFVEGNSTDKTWGQIKKAATKRKNIIALKQRGKGKADATWLGLKKAKGKMLMIYDADRTVPPNDLIKFYNALASNQGDFANGNRLLYPMETGAMQTLNKVGNQVFSSLFTWILGQRFKDTLCGTKVFWKHDFKKFKRSKTDPFGDFDLIFGAIRNKLRVVEIPVRYKERVFGSTNINRFYHGILLIKMTVIAFVEFKLLRRRNTQ